MEILKEFLKVKTIISLSLTVAYIVLAIKNNRIEEMTTIYMMVLAFYFGTQHQKNVNKIEENEKDKTGKSLEK